VHNGGRNVGVGAVAGSGLCVAGCAITGAVCQRQSDTTNMSVYGAALERVWNVAAGFGFGALGRRGHGGERAFCCSWVGRQGV